MEIGCVIMASGLGKRFGGNKLMYPFHGKPMIQYILDATEPIYPRIVVTRHEEVAALCRVQSIPVLLHDLPLRSDTVRLGLLALLKRSPQLLGCLFASADQPRLKKESIAALCRAFEQHPEHICRLSHSGTPGNPVLFPRSCFCALLNLPSGQGGSAVIRDNPQLLQLVPVEDPRELMDADTPQMLHALL